jgi:hypothetical protein
MFKKIFTSQQLSLFFQIAVLINITGLFCDLIIYHYFSKNEFFKLFAENLNNLSVFMICLTIVSQALFIFTEKHQQFVTRYKIVAITLEACIGIFVIWLVTIEDDLQAKTIIFFSSLSKANHGYRLLCTLAAIFIMLIFDFYRTLTAPDTIDQKSVPEKLHSIFRLVIRRHLIIFIFIFGIIQFETLNKFAQALLHHSTSSLLFDFSLLEFIIPIGWIAAICYYFYQLRQPRKKA